jgi:hypothetical protein
MDNLKRTLHKLFKLGRADAQEDTESSDSSGENVIKYTQIS